MKSQVKVEEVSKFDDIVTRNSRLRKIILFLRLGGRVDANMVLIKSRIKKFSVNIHGNKITLNDFKKFKKKFNNRLS